MIQLFYRYCTLDGAHEYQLITGNSNREKWVWFYLGRFLPKNIPSLRVRIIPYQYGDSVLLWEEEKTFKNALETARDIARKITTGIKQRKKPRKVKGLE